MHYKQIHKGPERTPGHEARAVACSIALSRGGTTILIGSLGALVSAEALATADVVAGVVTGVGSHHKDEEPDPPDDARLQEFLRDFALFIPAIFQTPEYNANRQTRQIQEDCEENGSDDDISRGVKVLAHFGSHGCDTGTPVGHIQHTVYDLRIVVVIAIVLICWLLQDQKTTEYKCKESHAKGAREQS